MCPFERCVNLSNAMLQIESIREEIKKMPPFLSIRQVAEFLQIDYLTVYRLVVVGEIDATKVAGVWRIPRSALLEYLEKRHPLNIGDRD